MSSSGALNDEIIAALPLPSAPRLQQEFYERGSLFGGSFGVRVSASGRKVFFCVYSLHGRRKRMTLGIFPNTSLLEARILALDAFRSSAAGKDPAAERRYYRRSGSFAELVEEFRNKHMLRKLKASTRVEYQRIIAKELLPLFGDRKVVDIRAMELDSFLKYFVVQRNAAVQASRIRAVLGSLFAFAKTQGLIAESPLGFVTAPKTHAPKYKILELEELRLIWSQSEALPPRAKAFLRLSLLSAQRPSTLYHLRWEQIRLDSCSLLNPPRELTLVPQALESLRLAREESHNSPYVFGRGSHDEPPPLRAYLLREFKRRRLTGQISGTWTLLDIYRSVAFAMARIGVPGELIDLLQGRRSPARFRPSPPEHFAKLRSSLQQWAAQLVPHVGPAPGSGKVRRLFG